MKVDEFTSQRMIVEKVGWRWIKVDDVKWLEMKVDEIK